MKKFFRNLKQEIEDKPVFAIAAVAAFITASAKLVDSVAGFESKRAYAKRTNQKVKKERG